MSRNDNLANVLPSVSVVFTFFNNCRCPYWFKFKIKSVESFRRHGRSSGWKSVDDVYCGATYITFLCRNSVEIVMFCCVDCCPHFIVNRTDIFSHKIHHYIIYALAVLCKKFNAQDIFEKHNKVEICKSLRCVANSHFFVFFSNNILA